MFCGFTNVILINLAYLSVMVAGDNIVSGKIPAPKLEIIKKGKYLQFQSTAPPNNPARCWTYDFRYRKCNENESSLVGNEDNNWTATLEYDAACKYTVQVLAMYSKYCEGELESDISEPVFYGEDHDPNLHFKVTMIIIPAIVSCCLVVALVLFRRHKDKILPKVPDPSQLIGNLFDSHKNGEMTKGPDERELYVATEGVIETITAIEGVTDTICVGPKTTLIQPQLELTQQNTMNVA